MAGGVDWGPVARYWSHWSPITVEEEAAARLPLPVEERPMGVVEGSLIARVCLDRLGISGNWLKTKRFSAQSHKKQN